MKKLLISTSIAAVFALAGCGGGDDLQEVVAETPKTNPATRIVFDPAGGAIPLPSDLLFAVIEQTDDGTLELPDEIAAQAAGGPLDFGQPGIAFGAIDGWSSQHPFTIPTANGGGIGLDPATVAAPGAVRIFEGAFGGNLNDEVCATAPALAGCRIYGELQFGVDFVTQASGESIAVVPLKPLAGSAQYYVVVTDAIRNQAGEPIQESSSYTSLTADVETLPLATPAQLSLQQLMNSYEDVVTQQGGVNADNIVYISTFTVSSNTEILQTVKQLQIGGFAQAVAAGADPATAAQFLPAVVANEGVAPTAFAVLAETLLGEETLAGLSAVGLGTCEGMIGAITDPSSPLFETAAGVFPQVGAFCAADLKQANINLPYYLSAAEPLTDSWSAACTNGLAMQTLGAETIGALLADGTISTGPFNDLCQAATGGQLLDLNLTNLGIDDQRHVTRFSPIPALKGSNADGTETLDVQITVPDPTVVGILASLPGSPVSPISKPENGWPVVILQHGITSRKEDFLAITGALSVAGYATVAIDHPLHGSRGMMQGEQSVNATGALGGGATDYMNLGSLLTTRDNLRQSIVDTLGLRLGLNAVVDLTEGSIDLDETNVSFVGQSLGSISGISTVALANTTLGEELGVFDGMYRFNSAVMSVPGGGVAGFLIESPSFGSLIKGSLLAASSADFQEFLVGYATQNQLPPEQALAPAFDAFFQLLTPEQQASTNAIFSEFVYAAQSITDAGDPNNFASMFAATETPLMVHQVVGGGTNDDGSTALPDQVIPNNTAGYPTFAGTDPLVTFLGLERVSSTMLGSGVVRFLTGSHSSLLDPSASAQTTTEMQTQAAGFLATGAIAVSNESIIEN